MEADRHLSEKARAAQDVLRGAASEYQKVVEEILDNPTGEIVERLRHVEERVSGAALHWALAYAEGAEPG